MKKTIFVYVRISSLKSRTIRMSAYTVYTIECIVYTVYTHDESLPKKFANRSEEPKYHWPNKLLGSLNYELLIGLSNRTIK